jgi:hypothetical protein
MGKRNIQKEIGIQKNIMEKRKEHHLDKLFVYFNEAVKNNPDKFPYGYLLEVSREEKKELVENFDRFNPLKHSTVTPIAFTEKGLYMLATILKLIKKQENKYHYTTKERIAAFYEKIQVTEQNQSSEIDWGKGKAKKYGKTG